MAKFNPDDWEKRMRSEMADEIAGEAAAAARAAQDDAQLRKELVDMFGGADYDAIVRAVGASEGYSAKEIKEMEQAAKLAKKQLKSNHPREAEKIIMSNRGLREVRKRKGKGCAVIAILLLAVGGSTFGAAIYGAAELIGALAR